MFCAFHLRKREYMGGIGDSCIRNTLKLQYWDDEFSTKFVKDKNPFNDMVMINGFIVNKNSKQNL